MDMYWIYDIPSIELGLGIKSIFLVTSLSALVITRRIIGKHFQKSHEIDQAVSAIFGSVGMLYGLLLGLVAVAAWQNHDKLKELVDEEAASIVQTYRTISVLKDPSHKLILDDLKGYTKDVIEVAWPAHRHGQNSNSGSDWVSSLHTKIADYESKAGNQTVGYSEAVSAFSAMTKARRMRIYSIDIGIPGELWIVIIGGAILTIPITFFFHMPSLKTHLIMTGFYVVFLGGMIALIAILDNPMRGELSISSQPYQKALDAMERIDQNHQPIPGK